MNEELFGELHYQEEYGLFGKEHERQQCFLHSVISSKTKIIHIMKIEEHKLWNTMNNLNFIKEYLKKNLIEELPDSFWEMLDESITDVETVVKTESNS